MSSPLSPSLGDTWRTKRSIMRLLGEDPEYPGEIEAGRAGRRFTVESYPIVRACEKSGHEHRTEDGAMVKVARSPVYQLKVSLKGSKPPIWRRLLVPSAVSLAQLHRVLQLAMGWTDSHLHQFEVHGQFYRVPDPEFGKGTKNEARVRLADVLTREKDGMTYEYDFGDGWEHKIVLEKILETHETPAVPRCIGGARACPPEDCGGVWGYMELLAALRDPSHESHDEMREWLGEDFDPEHFDVGETDALLASLRARVKP